MTARRLTALLLAASFAAGAAGCGGDDEPKIPRADAAELRSALLEAKRRLDPIRCGDLDEDSLPKLEERVAALPEGDVRQSLEDGVEHLRTLIEAECAAREREPDTSTDTTEEEPPSTTEEEPPSTTEEEPPSTTQPEPPTTQPPTTPPDNGNGGQSPPNGAVEPQRKREKKDKD